MFQTSFKLSLKKIILDCTLYSNVKSYISSYISHTEVNQDKSWSINRFRNHRQNNTGLHVKEFLIVCKWTERENRIVKGERKSRKADERKRGGSEVAEELVSFAPVHLWGFLVGAFLARGPWPAAAICSELVLRHHSRPSLLVSPANVWSFKLTFSVHSVYWRLCTDTNLWFFGAGRSCRSGGVGGGAGGRQTHSYFSFFFLGRFPFTYKKTLTLI